MTQTENLTGYSPGHPWYYIRGGRILSFKAIRQSVIERGYQGYMREQIAEADAKAEPKRSELLRSMRAEVVGTFRADAYRYRECAAVLRTRRAEGLDASEPLSCADVHQSIALKHNHLFNDFAHLIVLDELLTRQMDLFDF